MEHEIPLLAHASMSFVACIACYFLCQCGQAKPFAVRQGIPNGLDAKKVGVWAGKAQHVIDLQAESQGQKPSIFRAGFQIPAHPARD